MLGAARFSPCRRYRYLLTRGDAGARDHVVFVMLNPSTADARRNDPTITRCIGFADRLGCPRLSIVNLFALRATDPRRLYRARDPVGPDNDAAIAAAVRDATLVVAAWGNHGALHDRAAAVLRLLPAVHHFGLTRLGQPRHPLYLPGAAPLTAPSARTSRPAGRRGGTRPRAARG